MLIEQLRKDKMAALKAKDTVTNGVVSILISNLGLQSKELHRDLTEAEELAILQKELKQQNDSLAQTPASRQDLIDETKQKIAIIERYLPKQMSLEEVKDYILTKMETMKANGEEVPELNPKNYNRMIMTELAGKTDGKTVSTAVLELSKK